MTFTAFEGHRRLATGDLSEVALAVAATARRGSQGVVLVFADDTGAQVDLDLRGTDADIMARCRELESAISRQTGAQAPPTAAEPAGRGPGRPRLGVIGREVTLLPQHWEWLARQPGGASVALRKLVEQARRAGAGEERVRRAREAAYQFLYAIGGNLPDYDEVSRALFAGDDARLTTLTADWPDDVRRYLLARLAV